MNPLKTRSVLNTVLAGFTLSLASVALLACSGSDGSSLGNTPGNASSAGEQPNGSGSSESKPTPSLPAPSTTSLPAADAGVDGNAADAKPPRSMPLQCMASSQYGPTVCLETAEGKAGDIVDLEIHLVRSDTCDVANEAYGLIRMDPTYFELVNAGSQVDCTTRSQIPDTNRPGMDLITWQKFGNGSIAGCNAPAGIGKVDTLKLRIKPGTPPGDYGFGWETSEFWGTTPACEVMGQHIGSEIRVLP